MTLTVDAKMHRLFDGNAFAFLPDQVDLAYISKYAQEERTRKRCVIVCVHSV
jgi:hypothetical protein